MPISIIIPTCNEAGNIGPLIAYLKQYGGTALAEILVCDGGSTDATAAVAAAAGARVVPAAKGRAMQMHAGAAIAAGDTLYFVHADTFPPQGFAQDITTAVQQGYAIGRYRTRFDSRAWLLKLNAWFTRFDWWMCYGGDQTLFITKAVYQLAGGFNTTMLIMEEYEFTERARAYGRYLVLPGAATVSARKYEGRSWLQVQRANYRATQLYKKGASQETIAATYKQMLAK